MTICKDEEDVSEILPNLWLGNYKSALNKEFIKKHGIKRIINITKDIPCLFPNIIYLHIQIDDYEACGKDLNKTFDNATDFIYESLKSREPILVHCKRGHHRSASIVTAFIIRYLDTDYIDALTYINKIRRCALVRNTCMMNGLFNYYITLIHSREGKSHNIKCSCDVCQC